MIDADALDAEIERLTQLRVGQVAAADLADTAKTVDELRDDAEQAESEDYEAFWRAQKRGGKVLANVHGLDLQLPATLPLYFEVQARRLVDSRDPADVKYLFGILFGEDTYDELVARGMDAEQFAVLLMWGSANGNGRDMSLAQARGEYLRMRLAKDAEGKPRGLDSGATSSDSGRSSKQTSRGNTGSKKRRSRR